MRNKEMLPPTPYPELNVALQELIGSAQQALTDNFIGAYLQGSFAVGDFDLHSDADFVIAIEQELTDEQLQLLRTMHKHIYGLESEWAKHLEGSYFPKRKLRDYAQSGGELWYIDNGSRELERSAHDNTVVVRWILREKGVALAGPPPAKLIDPIPTEALRQEILETFTTWGEQILADPEQINSKFYQTFAVLSYCRMLHDLHTGVIGSKRAGAEWAKLNLDPSWRELIDRAWDGRPNPAHSVKQSADKADFRSTLKFRQEVMETAREFTAEILP